MWFIPAGYQPQAPDLSATRHWSCDSCQVTWVEQTKDRKGCWVCGDKPDPKAKVVYGTGIRYLPPEDGEPYGSLCDDAKASL